MPYPLRLMLLPIVYLFYTMADVIAIIVADVITTCYLVYYLADVIAMCVWQNVITTEADVIAYSILYLFG